MKKLLKLSVMVAFVFYGKQSYTQNPAWILAPNYFVDDDLRTLPQGPYSSSDYSGQSATTSQNAMVDQDGKLLFFIVDGNIYDGEGYIIRELPSVGGYDIKGGSEVMVTPDPFNCQRYYIFTVGRSNYSSSNARKKPFYCILDLSLPNITHTGRLGALAVVSGQEVFDISAMVPDYNHNDIGSGGVFFAVSEKMPDDSRFVFISSNYGIYRFLLNANFVYDGYFISFPSAVSKLDLRGEMELVKLPSGGYRIAVPFFFEHFDGHSIDARYAVYSVRLNDYGNIASPATYIPFYIPPSGPHPWVQGLEFSPDGSILYITHNISSTHPSPIEFYDFNNTGAGVQQLSVTSASDFESSQIEIGTDGALYFATGNRLARLNNPNTPNVSNWVNNAATITYAPNYEGTPYTSHHLKSYTLPDQTDGGSYTQHLDESTSCCLFYANFDAEVYNVTSNSTWNGTSNPIAPGKSVINIQKELRIKAGTTLTISGMTIRFAPGARLVIENGTGSGQGGKLRIMNNTVLTIDQQCGLDEMWLGVEVWGNTTAAQGNITNSTQGVFRMYSGSRIEHARIGVLASQRNESAGIPVPINSYNNNRNGGIVIVENSEFYNCQTGIWFQTYTVGSDNVSHILSSAFRWNGTFHNPAVKPLYHIRTYQCTDITVKASAFLQETPSIYSNRTQLGVGISTFNAGFKVYNSCSVVVPIGQSCPAASIIPSRFENLYQGISVTNPNYKSFLVLNSEFIDCRQGINSNRSRSQTISRNKFFIYEDDVYQTLGVLVTNGTDYIIEDNYFTENENPSVTNGDGLSYGIIIDNSGTSHNEVYKNVFERLYVGTQAQGVNGKHFQEINDGAEGLQYICNEFIAPVYLADIGVVGRIDIEQGLIGGSTLANARRRAARNKFSLFGENQSVYPDHDIMLAPGSQYINYVHLADNSHTPDNYTINGATQVIPQVQLFGGMPVWASTTNICPTNFLSFQGFQIEFPYEQSARLDSLSAIIDGGKQEELLNLIVSASGQTSTYDQLMNESPYLSDQVLESYIRSEASDVQVKNILVANGKLSAYLSIVLDQSGRSMALKNDMTLYKEIPSARKEVFNQIKESEQDLYRLQRNLIATIMLDTTIVETSDSLIKYLKLCKGVEFKKSLLAHYSNKQQQHEFESLLSDLSGILSAELMELYRIQYDLNKAGSMNEAVDQNKSLRSRLEVLAKGENNEASETAILLLDLLDGNSIEVEILPLRATHKNMLNQQQENSVDAINEFHAVKLFPNPSKGTVEFHFSELESATVTVQLIDLTGKEVFSSQFTNTARQQIDFSHLKKGTYLVKVVVDDQQFNAQLLILE